LNAEFRERNFLRCPVNIEVHDLSRGPTIRNWPNSAEKNSSIMSRPPRIVLAR
jgi:hypothetical protein